MTDSELKEMAKQLRRPHGANAVETGMMLHESNFNMTLNAIKNLALSKGDAVFELGHGNCSHLSELLSFAPELTYQGFDISEIMISEAERINGKFIKKNIAEFHLSDGENIPASDNFFDKGFTVNTLYFWENPIDYLNEIYRVMKHQALFAVTFGDKDYLAKQPFTKYDFTLYSSDDFLELVSKTDFKFHHKEQKSETIKSKVGNVVERIYNTIVLQK